MRRILPVIRRIQRLPFTSLVNHQINIMQEPVLYHKLDDVLEVLQDPRFEESPGVKELLEEYNKLKGSYDPTQKTKRHPLVVFEGLDGCGKSTTSKKFGKVIEAQPYRTPPNLLDYIRPLFEDNKTLRTAFYALGNYMGGMELHKLLETSPIVLDRFWHSTAAFAIAQTVHDFPETFQMPKKGDPIYKWPEDLIKPDLIFYLDVSEKNRLIRLSRRVEFTKQENLIRESRQFRNNIIDAYKNMECPGVTFLDSNKKIKDVVKSLENIYTDFVAKTN